MILRAKMNDLLSRWEAYVRDQPDQGKDYAGYYAGHDACAFQLRGVLNECAASDTAETMGEWGFDGLIPVVPGTLKPAFPQTGKAEAGPVGEAVAPLGYLKPENDYTLEPRFIYAKDRNEEWMSLVFTEPVYAQPVEEPGEVERLTRELRMIVSHATAGRTDGAGMSVNDVSVAITALRNELWQEARKKPEAALAETREALNRMVTLYEGEFDPETIPPRPDWLTAALTGDAQEAGK